MRSTQARHLDALRSTQGRAQGKDGSSPLARDAYGYESDYCRGRKTGIHETPHIQGPDTDHDRLRLHVRGYLWPGLRRSSAAPGAEAWLRPRVPATGPCDQTGTGGGPRLTSGGDSAAPAGLIWCSASFGGGFVLLDDAGRDAAALAHRDSLGFSPGPDVSAALPVC